jgi:hypothetical protein
MSWLTIIPVVHMGRRRIGRLLPLRIEPGRKLVPRSTVTIRRHPYKVRGFGYEGGYPVVHLEKLVRLEVREVGA